MLKASTFVLPCITIMALASLACAADSSEQEFTDPDKAGPDYAAQGEYAGVLQYEGEEHKWGAHVVALGDGKFQIVGYEGGLPGEGWMRGDHKLSYEGQTKDGAIVFEREDTTTVVKDGVMTVSHAGEELGSLKKIVRKSPTLGAKPPEGAIVLFDGSTAKHFNNGKIVQGNLLLADCESKQKFGDHSLHLEFRTPFKPFARGQARGNSGMYIQSRYEVQVLDSFGLEGRNNECGGIYSISEPAVNMCFPPLTWQTYDYDFKAARYDERGNKISNAQVTLRHNGVVIHDKLELPHGTPGRRQEGPEAEALYLQGHGNPVVYRNIWVLVKQ